MKQSGTGRREGRAGYSLVEVTLALLVVAIGLTATFALFPEGLRATRAAVDDTEISLFAEYVFTTLDLTVGKYGGDIGGNWDITDTDDFISMMLSQTAPQEKFELKDGGGVEQFYWIPDYYGLAAGGMQSSFFQDYWTSAFTYTLEVSRSNWKGYPIGATMYAVLKVWPGEVQGPADQARVFYREIIPIR